MLHLKFKLRTKSTLELVKLSQEGIRESVDFVVERYYPMVLKISSKYYTEWGEREDLVQNGLVGILKAIYYYKEGKSSFTSFVWKSIDSEIKSFLTYLNRRKNKMLTDSLKVDLLSNEASEDKTLDIGYEPNTLDEYIFEEFMKECKSILTDEEMKVFEMYIQHISYKEISACIGKSTKYVDNSLQKIKKKISSTVDIYRRIRMYISSIA